MLAWRMDVQTDRETDRQVYTLHFKNEFLLFISDENM
jgi:hypothetical protein